MLEKIDHGHVRELRFARPPANAFDPDFIQTLDEAVRSAPADGVRALIISGSPGMFTGGLDVPALIDLDHAGMLDFWKSFFGMLAGVATSGVPVVAAITGHSPAAGAVLATYCDYRVMADGPYKIGLNEVQVGLPVPPAIQYGLKRLTGPRRGDALLITGRLVKPDEALRLGIVDEVVPPEDVVVCARAWVDNLLELPATAMIETRRLARLDLAENFSKLDDQTYEMMTDAWFTDETQATMKALVAKLASRG